MRYVVTLMAIAGVCFAVTFDSNAKMRDEPSPNTGCIQLSLACADTVTPAFAPDGHLWLAARAGDRIFVTRSNDMGRSFAPPVQIALGGAKLDWGPDARPALVVGRDDQAYLAYAIFRNEKFDGEVFYTRSNDHGQTFAMPKPITVVQESQRFVALTVDQDGAIFAAWLDKRDRVQAVANGRNFVGAGLAFAWSHDGGESYSGTRIALDDTCECCRLGVGFAAPGRPVVLFRNVFDGKVRDHAVVTFDGPNTPGEIRRVSADDWVTDACPHHGPSLAIGADGTYHAAWFTQGNARKGLFYAYSRNQGRSFSAPMRLGGPDSIGSRPYVLAKDGIVYLAWKEFDGTSTKIILRKSHDAGSTWSLPSVIAQTGDNSDHPILVWDGHSAYLSWQTKTEGYRLIKLDSAS